MESRSSNTEAAKDCVVIVDPVAHFFRYVTAAKAKGLTPIVLASNEEVCRAEESGYAKFVGDYPADAIDIFLTYEADNDRSALEALLPYRDRILGLVAGDEVTVASTARIGRKLGFPYAAEADARCQQIKSLMKQRLVERGVPTARYIAVASLEEALEKWPEFNGDAMLKMVDYAMSYGVFRVKSESDLVAAWNKIDGYRHSLDHDFQTQDTVVLEEFVGGRGFSIEGYVSGDEIEILNFCEKLTHDNFMVVGHYIPACLDKDDETKLAAVAEKCVRALGIQNSIFHAEAHIFDGDAYIIECASRPPGQYAVGVMKRVYDFDLIELNMDLACGSEVDIRRRAPQSWNAIMALYSDRTGMVREIRALDELRDKPECYELKCGVEPGDVVMRLESFRDVLGLALLEADSFATVEETYDWARQSVKFCV